MSHNKRWPTWTIWQALYTNLWPSSSPPETTIVLPLIAFRSTLLSVPDLRWKRGIDCARVCYLPPNTVLYDLWYMIPPAALHSAVWCMYDTCTIAALLQHYHRTIIALPCHHYSTIRSLSYYHHGAIMLPSNHHHGAIMLPSQHHHMITWFTSLLHQHDTTIIAPSRDNYH